MENDEEAYRADLASPPRSSHSNRLGRGNTQSYLPHGADKAHGDGYEGTPLLAQEAQRLSENDLAEPVDRDGGARQWSGANDFAGRPWWNRPSVSSHSREVNGILIMYNRSIGCCQPSYYTPSPLVASSSQGSI